MTLYPGPARTGTGTPGAANSRRAVDGYSPGLTAHFICRLFGCWNNFASFQCRRYHRGLRDVGRVADQPHSQI